jgi:hypothetical protein
MSACPPKSTLLPHVHAVLKQPHLCTYLHSELYRLWDLPWQGMWRSPCLHPMSISRAQLHKVLDHVGDFVVSDKPDGVQYFLLLTRTPQHKQVAVMVDRTGAVYTVMVVADNAYFDGTLLVGELAWVLESITTDASSSQVVVNPNGDVAHGGDSTGSPSSSSSLQPMAISPSSFRLDDQAIPPTEQVDGPSTTFSSSTPSQPQSHPQRHGVWRHQFKVFSCLCLRGVAMHSKRWEERHCALQEAISIEDDPLKDTSTWLSRAAALAKQGKLICAGNQACMKFTLKSWQPLANLAALTRTTNTLTNPSDGFILMWVALKEQPGRHDGCFKLKEINTLDFGHTWEPITRSSSSSSSSSFSSSSSSSSYTAHHAVLPQSQSQMQVKLWVQYRGHTIPLNGCTHVRFQGKPVEFIPYNVPLPAAAAAAAAHLGPSTGALAPPYMRAGNALPALPPASPPTLHIGEFVCTILCVDSRTGVLKVCANYQEDRTCNKSTPNDTLTVTNTLINIAENITLAEFHQGVEMAVARRRERSTQPAAAAAAAATATAATATPSTAATTVPALAMTASTLSSVPRSAQPLLVPFMAGTSSRAPGPAYIQNVLERERECERQRSHML